ncbi:MAG TPA: ornithine racemase Orr [Clostridia bacterium]|nr:ornithine racemase Orr [Clostridia bacterium]
MNPRIEIDLDKIRYNTREVVGKCSKYNISVTGVTKVFCGDIDIAGAMVEGGVKALADSRVENIMKLKDLNVDKVFLRLPMHSEIQEIVRYADYSLNSEYDTIARISKESIKQKKIHNVILMVDLGDLREGVWYEYVDEIVREIIKLEGITLAGIGTNLTCYGGVIPSFENLSLLSRIAEGIRRKYKISLPVVSGGNSSSLHLVYEGSIPGGINNLRIGEAIALGRETAYGEKLDNLYDDIFTICGEIIEIKKKPSMPLGNVGVDAFGRKPQFTDIGDRYRAIAAIGRQDIDYQNMTPADSDIVIVGASSDHLIVDITDCSKQYRVGDEIRFKMAYGCLLRSMTSMYVKKVIINRDAHLSEPAV